MLRSNTNSNIESFNVTIKRDFSLRKRYSVWGSVDIIEEIILYCSTCKKEFWVTPKFDKDIKAQGKRCIIGPLKQRSNGKIIYKDKYMISLTERTCSCGNFMKHAVCGHILAYTYRHTRLDKECWFGEQYSNLPTEFARNAKRGAPKKQTGRPKNSEKALSKY